MRGFWLLALWVGFNDLLPMFIGSRDNVGHWAHLGGFMSGALLAVGLMVARLVDARRGDLLSVALGRHAWALLGRPGEPPAATTPWSTPKLGPSGNSAPAASPRP